MKCPVFDCEDEVENSIVWLLDRGIVFSLQACRPHRYAIMSNTDQWRLYGRPGPEPHEIYCAIALPHPIGGLEQYI